MYARFIDEFNVIPAPETYGNIRNFNEKTELMLQHGFLPVISDPLQSHMRPHYCIEGDHIRKSYVEYSGEALEQYRAYQQMYRRIAEAYGRPLTHMAPGKGEEYQWLDDPWPWEFSANKEG